MGDGDIVGRRSAEVADMGHQHESTAEVLLQLSQLVTHLGHPIREGLAQRRGRAGSGLDQSAETLG